jgi:hypothetical protein
MFILVRCPPCLSHGVTPRPPTKVEVVSAERELLCIFLWAKGRVSLIELLNGHNAQQFNRFISPAIGVPWGSVPRHPGLVRACGSILRIL